MTQFIPVLPEINHWPDSVRQAGVKAFKECPAGLSTNWTLAQQQEMTQVFAISKFVADVCGRFEDLPARVFNEPLTDSLINDWLTKEAQAAIDEEALKQCIRLIRNQVMAWLAWLDIMGRLDVMEMTRLASELADTCIRQVYQKQYQWHVEKLGQPVNANGEPVEMCILGMGKLGAHELNFSSDIDLIFSFSEHGETIGAAKPIPNEQFFIRLSQKVVSTIHQHTVDGFAFRVDMRLRPYGDAGLLAISFDSFSDYYERVGREWERYAMIKARIITGQPHEVTALKEIIKPFVFRRYVDYSVIDSLREMKKLIQKEIKRRQLQNNIKLGPGGIREIEFIGQVIQLIRGGKLPQLQIRPILSVLHQVEQLGIFPRAVVTDLSKAYRFLRVVEHRIQQHKDEQSQTLPADETGKQRLAVAMGFLSWDDFKSVLDGHMKTVHEHFSELIREPEDKSEGADDTCELGEIWASEFREEFESVESIFSTLCVSNPREVYDLLMQFKFGSARKELSRRGQTRLNRVMPMILREVQNISPTLETVQRLVRLLEAITKRTAYLELMLENSASLHRLVLLVANSPWIAERLALHPILLDEILDARRLYHYPPVREAVFDELNGLMIRVPQDDVELQMEIIREFKQSYLMRIAASDLTGRMAVTRVSDQLTFVAESILTSAYRLAWRHMVEKYGIPSGLVGASIDEPRGFCILAYGKLGGIELGYGSDLDVVFIHGGDSQGYTDGDRQLPNSVFFIKMAQRLIHLLSTRTVGGIAYEVDARLRPSGESGHLVQHINAFASYQRKQAWTWEHQAITRARAVCGDVELSAEFERVRQEVICLKRDDNKLFDDVVGMREKMIKSLGSKEPGTFHLKNDSGGLIDIEFIVQYLQLKNAYRCPDIIDNTDNIRSIGCIARHGIIELADALTLQSHYFTFRHKGHELALQNESRALSDDWYKNEREEIKCLWQKYVTI